MTPVDQPFVRHESSGALINKDKNARQLYLHQRNERLARKQLEKRVSDLEAIVQTLLNREQTKV